MTLLTIYTTLVEKNYIMFAVQKDEAGVVSLYLNILKLEYQQIALKNPCACLSFLLMNLKNKLIFSRT